MRLFRVLCLVLMAVTRGSSAPFDLLFEHNDKDLSGGVESRQVTGNEEGYHDGYFYSWWSDGDGYAKFTMGEGSKYSVEWKNVTNFVGGKGWNPGTGRTIHYSGEFNTSGNSYLAVYGFTQDPFVEYYVFESYGTYNPSNGGAQYKGSVDTDGGTYNIYASTRIGLPSVPEAPVMRRYWSVRTAKRVGGAITMQNHFDAWANAGLKLGTHSWQIVATEGYMSSGSSEIHVDAT